jgi:hypothetical protein
MAGAIRIFVMAITAGIARPHTLTTVGNLALGDKTMPGFELIGVAFTALCFTALQFAWLLESAKA